MWKANLRIPPSVCPEGAASVPCPLVLDQPTGLNLTMRMLVRAMCMLVRLCVWLGTFLPPEKCAALLGWPFPAPHFSSLVQSCGKLWSSEALKSIPGWGAWLALGNSMEALDPKHPVPPMERLVMAKHVSRPQPRHGPQQLSDEPMCLPVSSECGPGVLGSNNCV